MGAPWFCRKNMGRAAAGRLAVRQSARRGEAGSPSGNRGFGAKEACGHD
jgi:hypothetical protein